MERCLAVLTLLFAGISCSASAVDIRRPNIILMMADDMGMGDTSAYQDVTGNSDADQLSTPAMEKLARMGVRFTDAHTPASRCSPTRYGLLTGRYPWRNRLKHWVLFGAQGDPMIEADRPTLATMLRDAGYATGMTGKWHVGLRFRQSNGLPAAEFTDADLRQPLADSPLDHGFDFCRFTSRSHGTSGPEPGKKNTPDQTIGPGHIHGRVAIGATDNGRQLESAGNAAYVLKELGGRHFDDAMEFLNSCVADDSRNESPFFLYFPSNSNHGPHTPDEMVGSRPVAGAAKTVDGKSTTNRNDYIYENDAVLAGLLDWLEVTDDPRNTGHKLVENTLVIFTSDNGAESKSKIATGPFRSNKGSCYEGGHRVPFIAAWPAGNVGDGDPKTPGESRQQLICLTDVFATFAEITESEFPNNAAGEKGGEDSVSFLPSLQTNAKTDRPIFVHDHKESKKDHAVAVLRLDNPVVDGSVVVGQWKLFFDAGLLREGTANAIELYDLLTDPRETNNRISESDLQPLVEELTRIALKHRTVGGHRLADVTDDDRIAFAWNAASKTSVRGKHTTVNVAETVKKTIADQHQFSTDDVQLTIRSEHSDPSKASGHFAVNPRGLGIAGGRFEQVEGGEAILISFDEDVIVESVAIVAGNGVCGGHYHVGDDAALAIYCIDGDIDANDQSGVLSDIGVLRAGEVLRLDSDPHHGVETPGQWRLQSITVRRCRAQ